MRLVCDLCGQLLTGPDERCNSGIHQGPDDLNGFRGKAVPGEPEQIMETRGWKTCDACGVLFDEAYCPRCEEVGST